MQKLRLQKIIAALYLFYEIASALVILFRMEIFLCASQ
jgi:hypothetical protein